MEVKEESLILNEMVEKRQHHKAHDVLAGEISGICSQTGQNNFSQSSTQTTSKKPFSCSLCGKQCSHRGHLNWSHVNSHRREAVLLPSVRKEIPTQKKPERSHTNSQRREAFRLSSVRKGLQTQRTLSESLTKSRLEANPSPAHSVKRVSVINEPLTITSKSTLESVFTRAFSAERVSWIKDTLRIT